MGLRQIKKYEHTGAENVNTLDKGIMKEMQVAHSDLHQQEKKRRTSRKIIE